MNQAALTLTLDFPICAQHTAMEREIIIGYEPSLGDDALRLGGLLAETLAATPVIATVVRTPRNMVASPELERAVEADSRAGLERARAALPGLAAETRAIAARSPAEGLDGLAEEEGADLIVLGSGSRAGHGLLGLGSVAESLLRGAPCGVAVAPRGYADRSELRLLKVAVAFDGSPESWAALETGIGIAERVHGRLTILSVSEPPRYGYASAWSVLSAGEIRDSERELKEEVVELARARIPTDLETEARLETGYPGTVLAEASGEFDLMVAGSRGYGPLRRTLLGSSTRELIRSGSCPVILLPRGVSVDPLGARTNGSAAQGPARGATTTGQAARPAILAETEPTRTRRNGP